MVDGIALPFIVGAMAIFIGRLGEKIQAFDAGVMGVLIGLGMLAKGPLGLLPVFVIIVAIWFGRENIGGFIRNFLWVCLAVAIAAGIFLLWAVPANRATDGELYRVFFGKHIVGRAFADGRPRGKFSFIPAILPGDYGCGIFPVGDFSARRIFGKFGKKNREHGDKKYFIELDNSNGRPDDYRGDEAAALHIVCLARDGGDDRSNNCRIKTKRFK